MTSRRLHILILSQWFDPEPTFKGLLFAQKLVELGHRVTVLTGFPNYPGGRLYPGYRVRMIQRERIGGVTIVRVPLYPSHNSSGVRRAANYLSFAGSASIAALFIRRPDVAYVYHPPATVGLPAAVLKWIRGVPYVYDVQDLWPDTLGATGMLRGKALLGGVGFAMRRIYAGAARIAVLSSGFRERLVQRGVGVAKVEIIPNWADEAQISVVPVAPRRKLELGFDSDCTITFAGNMGPAQRLDTVVEAAEILRNEKGIKFLMVGGGIERARLAEDARKRGLENIRFLPRRPINEIGEVLLASDALLVHLREDPLFSITIPSKTQAYMMAGKPILMGVSGDAAALIEQAQAGFTFAPEDAVGLAGAARALRDMSQANREEMGKRGQEYYWRHQSLDTGARQFEKLLRDASLLRPRFLVLKRIGDVAISVLALLLGIIPIAIIAISVRAKLGSPIIFSQLRPGLFGKSFRMVKFRTMSDARHASGDLLPDKDRLGAFGTWLRRTSLDELPELWNVLRGQMAIVGPRPLLMRYTEFFTAEERIRLLVRPGITGLAQIRGRNELSWSARLASDVEYVHSMSIRRDFGIILRTALMVIRRDGVVADPETSMQNLDVERAGEAVQ